MNKLRNPEVTVVNPVEIDLAVEQIRQLMAQMTWLTHPFHIAQRFIEDKDGNKFYYPETYVKSADNKTYHRLTPDNEYKGMLFFYVGKSVNDYSNQTVEYPVAMIFSCNLEKIDKDKLKNYLFTQELITEARKKINSNIMNFMFDCQIVSEVRDIREVYQEFTLNDIEQYNRLPLQCFRIDLKIKITEEC